MALAKLDDICEPPEVLLQGVGLIGVATSNPATIKHPWLWLPNWLNLTLGSFLLCLARLRPMHYTVA